MIQLKRLSFFFVLLLSANLAFGQKATYDLMPMPKEMTQKEGKFIVDSTFRVAVTGNPDKRLYPNASRLVRRLSERTGIFLDKQGYVTKKDNNTSASLLITVKKPGKLGVHEDESYQLVIDSKQVKINASTDLGAIHGIETLLQLLSVDSQGYYFPAMEINDAPRFDWRGLMLDAGRHFMPVEVVERNLDGMAATKLNVLHWHLSENQGFRVESKIYPKLQELGSDGQYYTQEQIKDIVDYADERGIRVVPEFDVPGHATAMIVAYPQLASTDKKDYSLDRYWGIMDPTLNPTKDETYQFLDSLFGEMTALFPDQYFHIGGDENNGKEWDQNPEIQAYMKAHQIKNNEELQTAFNKRLMPMLKKYGKKMMGWDEILQPGAPKDIIIQSWRGKESLYQAAKDGYQGILSNGYYIDLMEPTDKHYLNDPIPADADLTDAQKKLILGGEATMWSEHVTPETVDSRIWPRTAAIAERFWSPREVNDVQDMYKRLDKISLYLESVGLMHLRNKGMLMRRLTNSYDTDALEVLVDVIEPLQGYHRNKNGTMYTAFSPYTKIADVATADQRVAREFRNSVDQYLQKPKEKEAKNIRAKLTLWENNHHKLLPVIRKSPVLEEIEELSYHLSALGTTGLEAMDIIEYHTTVPEGWADSARKKVEDAKQEGGRTEIRVVSAVEKLVDMASGSDKTNSPGK